MLTPTFRADHGWRSRPLFGALRLRPPAAQHTQVEGMLLRKLARDACTIVEIGVAEGGSAWEVAQVMRPDATLHLVDPYFRRSLGKIVPARNIARRLVGSVARGQIDWVERFSHDAIRGWNKPIDLLFLDGDHTYEGVKRDFDEWTPHLTREGQVALHDARAEAAWTQAHHGPVRLLEELSQSPHWCLTDAVDSLAVLRRS